MGDIYHLLYLLNIKATTKWSILALYVAPHYKHIGESRVVLMVNKLEREMPK